MSVKDFSPFERKKKQANYFMRQQVYTHLAYEFKGTVYHLNGYVHSVHTDFLAFKDMKSIMEIPIYWESILVIERSSRKPFINLEARKKLYEVKHGKRE